MRRKETARYGSTSAGKGDGLHVIIGREQGNNRGATFSGARDRIKMREGAGKWRNCPGKVEEDSESENLLFFKEKWPAEEEIPIQVDFMRAFLQFPLRDYCKRG